MSKLQNRAKARATLIAPALGAEGELALLAEQLLAARPADLWRDCAVPWSLRVACRVTDAPLANAAALSGLARTIFAAAAEGAELPKAETVELAGRVGAMHVQAFVALAHTLPCFLASAWCALLRHPAELAALRADLGLLPAALEELLRYAGPAQAQLRYAVEPLSYGPVLIAAGARVWLMLAAANRDAAIFPEPDQLLLHRQPNPHVAFGAGPHACAGAALVRWAALLALRAFLAASKMELEGEPAVQGGFAICGLASLPVSYSGP